MRRLVARAVVETKDVMLNNVEFVSLITRGLANVTIIMAHLARCRHWVLYLVRSNNNAMVQDRIIKLDSQFGAGRWNSIGLGNWSTPLAGTDFFSEYP